MAPAAEPSEAVVRDAIARVIARYTRGVRVVVTHGSWVRGDFWPGQSDLDLIVVTDWDTPYDLRRELMALESTLGLPVEPWQLTEGQLEAWRTIRSRTPGALTDFVQLDISGFDVVDHHLVLWPASGPDPLAEFPVPRGRDLQAAAIPRVRQLLEYDFVRWGDTEANRIACDALKAATIFFLLEGCLPPTRDKREIFDRFMAVVPDFPHRRETAERIWELYRAGDKDGGRQHREVCREFVGELVKLIAPFS